MCWNFNHCCFGLTKFGKHFKHEIEKADDELIIKIKAKSPEKAESLKKMFEAHREFCGEN
jgi:hypothetical protein